MRKLSKIQIELMADGRYKVYHEYENQGGAGVECFDTWAQATEAVSTLEQGSDQDRGEQAS